MHQWLSTDAKEAQEKINFTVNWTSSLGNPDAQSEDFRCFVYLIAFTWAKMVCVLCAYKLFGMLADAMGL